MTGIRNRREPGFTVSDTVATRQRELALEVQSDDESGFRRTMRPMLDFWQRHHDFVMLIAASALVVLVLAAVAVAMYQSKGLDKALGL